MADLAIQQAALARPAIRRIGLNDLRVALARGWADFAAKPSHVAVLALVYPVIGLILAFLSFGYDVIPLAFPLAAGFALVGPVAALGLYEISRRREARTGSSWFRVFDLPFLPQAGEIARAAAALIGLFLMWLIVAYALYSQIYPAHYRPESIVAFLGDVLTTTRGWTLILAGFAFGFVFAATALAVGAFSFPMLVDRDVSAREAIETSVRAVLANPIPMAAWGLIVAAGLALGSLPAFLGLVVAIPVLGHATWHLYRATIDASAVGRDRALDPVPEAAEL